jgi:hypothetical protein
MHRVLAIPAYAQMFAIAYPSVSQDRLGFEHAANAIAAFETQSLTKTNSAFDRYLAHEDNALSLDAKHGALLFFTTARCVSCHNGPLLGAQSFASVAVPQLGPGSGTAAPLDIGRGDETVFRAVSLPEVLLPCGAAPQRRAHCAVHAQRRVSEPRGSSTPLQQRGFGGEVVRRQSVAAIIAVELSRRRGDHLVAAHVA